MSPIQKRDGGRISTPLAPADELVERDFEVTYYESGAIRSQRVRERICTRAYIYDYNVDEWSQRGCLYKLFTFYMSALSFVAAALTGYWLLGKWYWGAVSLLIWVVIVSARDE